LMINHHDRNQKEVLNLVYKSKPKVDCAFNNLSTTTKSSILFIKYND
jgi:hypothetical protein